MSRIIIGLVIICASFYGLFNYFTYHSVLHHLDKAGKDGAVSSGSFYGFTIGMTKDETIARIKVISNDLYLGENIFPLPVFSNNHPYASFHAEGTGADGSEAPPTQYEISKEESALKDLMAYDNWQIKIVYVDWPAPGSRPPIDRSSAFTEAPSSAIPFDLTEYPEMAALFRQKKIAAYYKFNFIFKKNKLIRIDYSHPNVLLLNGVNGAPMGQIYP